MAKKISYWERRKATEMYEYMEDAEAVADQIAKLYLKASRYISMQADDIFEKYMTKHKLTKDEALELLDTLQDRTSLDELLEKLRNGTKDKNKEEILSELEAPAYRARLERLQQLQNQLDYVMRNIYQQEKTFTTPHYVDLANEAYYRGIFDVQQQVGAAFSFHVVDPQVIDQVINSRWSGENYSKRIWKNTQALAQDLKEELLINLVTGRTNREAAEIIQSKFAAGASAARRLIRTESNYVATELNFKAYEECGIEKYRFCAVLDLRTSETCRKLDRKIFLVSKRTAGVNCPPMHPWCRSTTIEVITEELANSLTRRVRDPVTGEIIHIPASMTYQEWYDKYVKGNPEAELAEKQIKNRSSDRKQHKKYREILGDEIPEELDEFQRMKYTDSNKYGIWKAQYKGMGYYSKAVANEPQITAHIKKVAENIGMDMAGLEYRIKGKESYLRKIASNYSPNGNEYEVKDILRYTYTTTPEKLVESTLKSIETHQDMGYNTIEVKNYWLDKNNPYNGINTTIQAQNGQKFELQYHTSESYSVKDAIHGLYEKWRIMDKASPEAIQLRKGMFEQSSKLHVPERIEEVKK